MNTGDWIQVLGLIVVFMVVVIIIYSLINWPWYASVLLIIAALIAGWLVNRFIKL